MVVVFFHGGFALLLLRVFRSSIAPAAVVRLGSAQAAISVSDARSALFFGLRALQSGKSILIAADAQIGKLASTIRVLDTNVPIADGTAFLAYESGCQTYWLGLNRKEDRLVPDLVLGPARDEGERYEDFKARWLNFYANQLQALSTGDPRNIAFRGQWMASIRNKVMQIEQRRHSIIAAAFPLQV